MTTDDLRAELDRLEAMWADKTDAESRNDSDALYLATWKAEAEAVNAFPRLAAELRRLWAFEAKVVPPGVEGLAYRSKLDGAERRVRQLEAELERLRGRWVDDRGPMPPQSWHEEASQTMPPDVELEALRREVSALHAQLQRQAYVVPEGAQLVVPPHVGQVGYVLVRGGHVAVQEGPVSDGHRQ